MPPSSADETPADPFADEPRRRRFSRVAQQIPVKIFDGRQTRPAVLRNVSLGGAFVAIDPPLALGTGLSVPVQTPVGPIGMRGVVRWTRSLPGPGGQPVGVGIAFAEMDDDTLDRLAAWLSSEGT
jgi:hypothetical protein